jgi:putative ABC transport system permease protein
VDQQWTAPTRAQIDALVSGQPGVQHWSYGDYAPVTAGGRAIPAIGIAPGRGATMTPQIVEGHAPRSDHEVAFGATTLARLHAHVGDRVKATVGDRTVVLDVVGRAVFPAFGQGSFTPTGLGEGALISDRVASASDVTRPPGAGETHNFVLVGLAPGPHHDAQVAALVRHVARTGQCIAGQCAVLTAQRPGDIKNYARVRSTPVVLAGLLALLALASIAHVLITSIRRRRRDLAVLKTLGFERRQVSASVAWQATTLVLIALAIGLPAGIVGGRFAWDLFASRLGVVPATRMPVTAVLVAIPVGLVVANLLALAPGWVAGRLRPATVLRTE